MQFEQVLEKCKGPEPRAHRPAFRIEPRRGGWRIFDGDRAIADALPQAFDIWSFSPFEPDEIVANSAQDTTKTLDVHTVRNTWLNFGIHGWPQRWREMGAAALRWDWRKSSGVELEAQISLDAPDGEFGRWTFRVRFDPDWGRCRYTWDIHARTLRRDGMELFNMMISRALADRAQERRWTHTISPNLDGELTRIPNSNAIFLAHGHLASRHTTYPRTWVAYAGHRSFNPITLVHRTTAPMEFAFCDQLFDQHLIWPSAGMDNFEADGYFHCRMSLEFANLHPTAATNLLEKARDPVRARMRALGDRTRVAVPFRVGGVVNSFEDEVEPWDPVECPILVIDSAQAGTTDWDTAVGRTGKRSIRLSTEAAAGAVRRELFPQGAVCLVRPHHKYRLEGWIRTRGVEHFARLELATCEYTYANLINVAASSDVVGDADWTRVEAIIDAGDQAYVLPKMVLYGPGTAWFDDLSLTELT